ncbi:ABC transporter ATP-binding protein [Patescibacteria group bacterium]|nr:ABC transporter ATP-binding protein [Patescibacteria group bacterium]
MTSPALHTIFQAKNVGKTFSVKAQDITVLSDVNMEVQKSEFLVIFGPSGCGKSTLLHTLLGLEQPTSGDVSFLGSSLYRNLDEDGRSDIRKRHIGMVYQQPNWIKALTVKENIMVPLRLSGATLASASDRAEEVLKLVGMTDWRDYIPTELSSGQQQKVALARAVVTNPDVLIADEPTGNLDFESGKELMRLLSSLHQNGKTVIMVTHDLEYLMYAGRALQMFDGKIIEEVNDPDRFVKDNHLAMKRGQSEPILMPEEKNESPKPNGIKTSVENL